jgi:type IV pilus assembly protein PilW
MKRSTTAPARHLPPLQRGFTLVELLIAMAIALFLVGGVLTLLETTRRTSTAQSQLALLQDNERLAMALMTDVVQAAGYYPDPTTNTSATALPAVGAFAAGQPITGTDAVAAPGDSITARYLTASNDGIINCTGGSNATAGPVLYTNLFSVNIAAGVNVLQCSLNGAAAVPLVSGVTNLQILYGVKTNFAVDNGSVDSYLKGSEMVAANWSNVIAVKITLTFVNPIANQAGQPATIPFTRVIGVMNKAGVHT